MTPLHSCKALIIPTLIWPKTGRPKMYAAALDVLQPLKFLSQSAQLASLAPPFLASVWLAKCCQTLCGQLPKLAPRQFKRGPRPRASARLAVLGASATRPTLEGMGGERRWAEGVSLLADSRGPERLKRGMPLLPARCKPRLPGASSIVRGLLPRLPEPRDRRSLKSPFRGNAVQIDGSASPLRAVDSESPRRRRAAPAAVWPRLCIEPRHCADVAPWPTGPGTTAS